MFKQLLQQTIPLIENLDVPAMLSRAGISAERYQQIIDSNRDDDVTQAEYLALLKVIPVSVGGSIKSLSEASQELEYLEAQLGSLVETADDSHLPLFAGMARLVRRVALMIS